MTDHLHGMLAASVAATDDDLLAMELAPTGPRAGADTGDPRTATRVLHESADGAQRRVVPGTVVVLPKGWSGRWDVHETVRKLFIVVS